MASLKPTTNDKVKQFPEDPRDKKRLATLPGKRKKLSFGFLQYGYVSADGDPIPDEYLVRITSYRNNCTIIAPLQENIDLKVESYWEPVVPTSILRAANILLQATTGGVRSAVTSATTRRIWQGTSPISIALRLKFEAVSNPYIEVVEPCRLLQTMAAPSDPAADRKPADVGGIVSKWVGLNFTEAWAATKEAFADLPMLIPPGPSPFVWDNLLSGQTNYTDKNQAEIEASSRGGDFIMVEFGTFLTFWNVVIKSGGVSYKTRFNDEGYPVSAEAEVVFETYEMPTKESLEHSYTKIVPEKK